MTTLRRRTTFTSTATAGVTMAVLCFLAATETLALAPPPTSTVFRNTPGVVAPSFTSSFSLRNRHLLWAMSTDHETEQDTAASQETTSSSTSLLSSSSVTSETSSWSSQTSSLDTSFLPPWMQSAAWRMVIVVLCVLWASNFAVAKLVMAEPNVDSSLYALSRFGVAAAALAPFALTSSLSNKDGGETVDLDYSNNATDGDDIEDTAIDGETVQQAFVCGSWVAFGYLGQTLGLLTTTASKSCVICSMHCVFVAIIAELWRTQKANKEQEQISLAAASGNMDTTTSKATQFDVTQLLPAAIAVTGVAIVELQGAGGAPTIGDALSFAQPIGFGMGYLILEDLMAKKPKAALLVSAIKLGVVALASLVLFEVSPLLQQGGVTDLSNFALTVPDFSPILSSPTALSGILYTGLVTTAFALWIESIAFAKVPATDASLILTTEPLFAAGCGALALGETFGLSDYVGASLIIGGCALSIFIDDPEEKEQGKQQQLQE